MLPKKTQKRLRLKAVLNRLLVLARERVNQPCNQLVIKSSFSELFPRVLKFPFEILCSFRAFACTKNKQLVQRRR